MTKKSRKPKYGSNLEARVRKRMRRENQDKALEDFTGFDMMFNNDGHAKRRAALERGRYKWQHEMSKEQRSAARRRKKEMRESVKISGKKERALAKIRKFTRVGAE